MTRIRAKSKLVPVRVVCQNKGTPNKGLHQTRRVGVPASRAVVEARFAGEPRCCAHVGTAP